MSLISLIAFMLLQTFGRIPPSASIVKPFKQTLHEAITMSGADANMTQILEEGFRQATVQLPGFIIIITFLIVLINLIVTFPILRKFKIATPVFKPLFAWQMSGIFIMDIHYCYHMFIIYRSTECVPEHSFKLPTCVIISDVYSRVKCYSFLW